MTTASAIRSFDAVKALAFVGDLSMGQPIDHSLRTAWLAAEIARAAGLDPAVCETVREAALLRWSGCTANAPDFAEAIGDDVAGREAMLAMRPDWAIALEPLGGIAAAITPLTRIHCEVSVEVARILGLDSRTEATLRHIFETYDGCGLPDRLAADRIPMPVFVVALAGDLEIFSRVYGLDRALALIAGEADIRYPSTLVRKASTSAGRWLEVLSQRTPGELETALLTGSMQAMTAPELIADVADLKLPWMTGFSRAVAKAGALCAARLGMDEASQGTIYHAGLIHGIGRAAISNAVWNAPGEPSAAAWEKIRLAPYWTSRAGRQIAALQKEAEIASFAYERLDGSGYFRGATGNTIPSEAQVLAVALAWTELQMQSPRQDGLSATAAAARLRSEARLGRLSSEAVEAMMASGPVLRPPEPKRATTLRLSPRETDVLRRISFGASNKEIARTLALRPSTVRTHVESVFRKLECSTRAAATLKASALGLL